ncbi:MAG: hypothetical protein E6J77_10565 [Deltaproteobacteria bacterium]|nr:MAG: hypothetical protein E6J77_10565 [Deltaproteobacteria bacterium]
MLLNGPRLTHRVPFLWRFHVVHHIRVAQVVTIGVSPLALSIWQTGLLVSILFHHSHVRLPVVLERRLALVVVTPRLHVIHHSIVRTETDSN